MFSLILCTLNRASELRVCLDSLSGQTYKNFEIIIVDQSNNNDTEIMIRDFHELNVVYRRVDFYGLSKARNFAMNLAKGDYFCLIDDDASYSSNYLSTAKEYLQCHKNILSGMIVDVLGNPAVKEYRRTKDNTVLSTRRIRRMVPSPAVIFPREIWDNGIRFDEMLGVGGLYGACEETDVILQSVDNGMRVVYLEKLCVTHPTMPHTYEIENHSELEKIEKYASGFGALVAKDFFLRGKRRLLFLYWENRVKILIKRTGIIGVYRKKLAEAEYNGLHRGYDGMKRLQLKKDEV